MSLHLHNSKFNVFFSNALNIWRNIFGSTFTESQPKLRIENLVQQLSELPNVEQVRAVASKNTKLNEITFEVLSNVDFDEEIELEKAAINLVVKTELELCKLFKAESWYFRTQLLKQFDTSVNNSQIIKFSNAQSNSISAASCI